MKELIWGSGSAIVKYKRYEKAYFSPTPKSLGCRGKNGRGRSRCFRLELGPKIFLVVIGAKEQQISFVL